MRAANALRTARELGVVRRELRGIDRDSKRASAQTGLFARAVTLLGTRMGATILMAGALTFTLGPPLLAALALATAGLIALGGAMLPVFALGAGAMMLFKHNSERAGTAAIALQDALRSLKHSFYVAISPGAAALMRGAAKALEILLPMIEGFRGVLTTFGQQVGASLVTAAHGLVGLGPQISRMIALAGPLVAKWITALPTLIGLLVDTAIYGMPVLSRVTDWLLGFIHWLRPALAAVNEWAHGAQAASIVSTVFHGISVAARYLADVAQNLYGIILQVWDSFKPAAQLQLGLYAWELRAFADALRWLNENGVITGPIMSALLVGFLAWRQIAVLIQIINGIAGALMFLAANPVLLVVAAIAAVAYGFYLAYTRSQEFRDIVDSSLRAVGDAALWVKDIFVGLFHAIEDVVTLGGTVPWIAKHLGFLLPGGAGGGLPFLADGGTVRHGGAAVVGEKGPEIVTLPGGSVVHPTGTALAAAGDVVVPVTLVMNDGPVARATARASLRRKSVR